LISVAAWALLSGSFMITVVRRSVSISQRSDSR
jgi:hypothetical protein